MKADEETPAAPSRRTKKKRPVKPKAKRGSPLKWILIIGASLLVLLCAGLFVATGMIQSWLRGEGFRSRMLSVAESTLQAKVSLDDLSWEGSSIYIAGLQAQGYREAAIARLDVDGVRGTFDGTANQAWQVPNVTMNQLSVEFSDDHLPQRADIAIEDDPKAGLNSVPRFLRSWIPQRTEIGMVRIDATNLVVKDSTGAETFALHAIETASKPISGSLGGWRIQGRGGEMRIVGQPDVRVEKFDLRWTGSDVYLNSAAFGVYERAHIEADGEVAFGDERNMNLRLRIENLDSAEVLDAKWRERLSGTLSGDMQINGDFGQADGLVQSGTLSLANGVLKDLPLLKKIVTYTKSPKFHPLVLHQASMEFERRGEHLVIRELVIESDGLTRLEGSLTLDGEVIAAGNFRLGVTPGTLGFIPGAERKVFTESEGGFLWTDVQIAGTLSQLQENLTQRLVGAAIESVVEDAPGKVLDTAKDAITDPTGTAGGLIEQGTGLLKGFAPFLK